MGERNDVWKENTRFNLSQNALEHRPQVGFPNMSVAEEKDKEKVLVSDRASLSPQSVLRLSRSRLGDTVLFNRINTGTEADRELWYYTSLHLRRGTQSMVHAVNLVEGTTANHLDRFLLLKQTRKIQWQHASPDVRGRVPWVHFKDLPPFPCSLPSPNGLEKLQVASKPATSLQLVQLLQASPCHRKGLHPSPGALQNFTGSTRTRESTRTM